LSTAALVKALPLHHELGQPRDAIRDAPRFVRREVIMRKANILKIVAVMHIGQRYAFGVTDDKRSRAVSVDLPWRRKTAFGTA
jgi:hypothetical protein